MYVCEVDVDGELIDLMYAFVFVVCKELSYRH